MELIEAAIDWFTLNSKTPVPVTQTMIQYDYRLIKTSLKDFGMKEGLEMNKTLRTVLMTVLQNVTFEDADIAVPHNIVRLSKQILGSSVLKDIQPMEPEICFEDVEMEGLNKLEAIKDHPRFQSSMFVPDKRPKAVFEYEKSMFASDTIQAKTTAHGFKKFNEKNYGLDLDEGIDVLSLLEERPR